ncbi:MAG TPA: ribbon-helix-helix domain-containing protein [Nitrospira sp.]
MPKLVRIVIQLPIELKEQLDALKQQGYTTSGFIRAMLERELAKLGKNEEDTGAVLPLAKRVNSR